MDGNKEDGGRRFVDGKSLWGLALLGGLILFGALSSVRECAHPSQHKSIRESLRELGEAVESEYGVLSPAEPSPTIDTVRVTDGFQPDQEDGR